ncbi:MAG: hypothetical protein ACYDA6_00135 [Solirubrobacteraceae bacterium]
MSRTSVRAAVAAYLAPPNVTGLNTMYASARRIPATAYGLASAGGSGTAGFVHLEDEDDRVISINGAGGKRIVHYRIGIVLRFKSVKVSPVTAMADYDAMIDALKTRLRADPTLGTTGGANPILTAGMGFATGGGGQPDLRLASDLPRQDKGGATYIWSVMRLSVSEAI